MNHQVKAITLNCWGVPVVARNRAHRMHAIAEWLATADYDFIFLEEVWLKSDYALIRTKTEKQYPHSHYFYSGVIGSGTCILSRHPFSTSLYHRSPVNGFAHMVHHGDWFGGKGVGFCQARCRGLTVNLYTTHLHANYNKARDVYSCHRLVQSFDCAQFVRMTSFGADLIIFAGDFNTNPDELPYKVVTHCAGLKDAYYLDSSTNKEVPEEPTCEAPKNSYTSSGSVLEHGERIDLVFVGTRGSTRLEEVLYSQPMPAVVPGASFSFSDHEAVAVTLRLSTLPDAAAKWIFHPCNRRDGVLREALTVCETYLRSLHVDQIFHVVLSVLLLAVLVATLGVPVLHGWAQGLLRLVITLMFGYTVFMASVWNRMERAGITAGMCDLRVALNKCPESGSSPPPAGRRDSTDCDGNTELTSGDQDNATANGSF
ncbi:putative neutral sphingomyelinase [Pollicipes pollicipes]|uniref:putative neutral sphingomyelinase n=1 Tax=Pollicipes pollicipes TaxID=41117 RepID=UPI001884CC7C|nr:putative neutral sphingomyelinase [Pollicipes pollicipes]